MAPNPEELAPGVYRIDAVGLSHQVSVLAVSCDEGWTLVDTGVPSSAKRIQAALNALGVGPNKLARIYLTHHHYDHVGGLLGMHEWATGAEIVASEHEAAIISGKQLPDPSSSAIIRRIQRLTKLPAVPISRTTAAGETVAGFRVVATPGHSRGHTSLLSEQQGLLFAADAFGALPRKLRVGVRKGLCNDPSMAKRSAEKLLNEDYRTVVFAHGKVLRENPKDRLRQVLSACRYDEEPETH